MSRHEWKRYAAPGAFLLAATIAIVLIHSGLEAGGKDSRGSITVQVATSPGHSSTTVARTVTTKKAAAGRRFWIVRAGDTFGVISTKAGVPVATLEQLNPKVHSTSLFIGERIRLR